jgi:hypothetical protein
LEKLFASLPNISPSYHRLFPFPKAGHSYVGGFEKNENSHPERLNFLSKIKVIKSSSQLSSHVSGREKKGSKKKFIGRVKPDVGNQKVSVKKSFLIFDVVP